MKRFMPMLIFGLVTVSSMLAIHSIAKQVLTDDASYLPQDILFVEDTGGFMRVVKVDRINSGPRPIAFPSSVCPRPSNTELDIRISSILRSARI